MTQSDRGSSAVLPGDLLTVLRNRPKTKWEHTERRHRLWMLGEPVMFRVRIVRQLEETQDEETELEQVIERYAALIAAVVARTYSGRLGIEVEDIVQEVRIKLWKERLKQRKIDNLKAFICRIAFTTTIDEIRNIKRLKKEALPDDSHQVHALMSADASANPPPSPAVELERQEMQKLVANAVDSLGENRRQAVRLYLYGMNFKEIAASFNWSEIKARNLLYRGLRDLRDIMGKKGKNYEVNRS